MKKQKVIAKKCLHILVLVPLLFVFCTEVSAAEKELSYDEYSDELSELVPDEFAELSEVGLGVDGLFAELSSVIRGQLGSIGEFFTFFIVITVILLVSDLLLPDGSFGEGVALICSVAVMSRLFPIVRSVNEALAESSAFFGGAIPILCTVSAGSGAISLAGAGSGSVAIILWITDLLGREMLMPLVVGTYTLGVVSSDSRAPSARLRVGMKNCFTKGVGVVSAVISGVSGLQTVVATAADSAAIRTAKYAASNVIPVVGGVLSGTISTLAGGTAYAVSTLGSTVVATLVLMSLSPLCMLLGFRLAVFFASFLSDLCGSKGGVIDATAGAFDCMIVVYSCCMVMLILQSLIFVSGGARIG